MSVCLDDMPKIYSPDDLYFRILETSSEFEAANQGFGPYVEFGLTLLYEKLTMAVG